MTGVSPLGMNDGKAKGMLLADASPSCHRQSIIYIGVIGWWLLRAAFGRGYLCPPLLPPPLFPPPLAELLRLPVLRFPPPIDFLGLPERLKDGRELPRFGVKVLLGLRCIPVFEGRLPPLNEAEFTPLWLGFTVVRVLLSRWLR